MSATVCADVLELLQSICQAEYDVLIIEPDNLAQHDLDILLRFTPQSVSIVYLVSEQFQLDHPTLEKNNQIELLVKFAGYLTALPYLIQNIIFKRNYHPENGEEPRKTSATITTHGWCELDGDLRFQRSSPSFESMLEFRQEDLSQFKIYDLFPPESQDQIKKVVDESPPKLDDRFLEIKFKNKTGDQKFLTAHFHRITNNVEKTIGWRCEFFFNHDFKPAPLHNESKLTIAEKLWDFSNENYQMTFPVFFRSLGKKCVELIDCEQISIARYNPTSGKFLYEAIKGKQLPLQAIIESESTPVFKNQAAEKPALYFFSIESQKLVPTSDSDNWIKTPANFGLDNGIILPFSDLNGNPAGCLAFAGADISMPQEELIQKLQTVLLIFTLVLNSFFAKTFQEKKERRLQQILVTSSIFKLQLPMRSLMREMAWAIKFSFDAFLATLALFDEKDQSLGFYAVASDDKHLILSLAEERVQQSTFLDCLKNGKTIRKSHLVPKIGTANSLDLSSGTSGTGFIVSPIFNHDRKMMGAIVLCERRNIPIFENESITILETIAKQIAVGIGNRVLYSRALKRENTRKTVPESVKSNGKPHAEVNQKQRFWGKIFS